MQKKDPSIWVFHCFSILFKYNLRFSIPEAQMNPQRFPWPWGYPTNGWFIRRNTIPKWITRGTMGYSILGKPPCWFTPHVSWLNREFFFLGVLSSGISPTIFNLFQGFHPFSGESFTSFHILHPHYSPKALALSPFSWSKTTWRFPEIGLPAGYHPFLDGIFH